MNRILNQPQRIQCLAVILIGTCFAAANRCVGQPPNLPDIFGSSDLEGVPSAAMLTERGRQLADELRNLRRSRDTMGLRHPSRSAVVARIAEIEEQLKAWAPASGEPEKNPFDSKRTISPEGILPSPVSDPANRVKPLMNEVDMRQLVLKLYRKIEQLEKRIEVLERR